LRRIELGVDSRAVTLAALPVAAHEVLGAIGTTLPGAHARHLTRSASFAKSSGRILVATSRLGAVQLARQTSPTPAAPSVVVMPKWTALL
jgi:hypothetical protein